MDTTVRTIIKAVSWQCSGLVVMVLLGYYYTGSFGSAFSLAGSSTVIGLVCYFLHEKLWGRVRWGRVV